MPEVSSPATNSKPPHPAKILKAYGLKAKKALGQHFLINLDLARKIVSLAGLDPEETVIELGVGLGILTLALAERAKQVIGFELDEGLLKILKEEDYLPPNVVLRQGDILHLDYRALSEEIGRPLLLFGNLPYYLSSRLLYRLIEERDILREAVFMFQKEVAERLTASPGSKDYGPLTVYLRLCARPEWLLTLSPAHFYPRPEVSSAVLKITFSPEPLPEEEFLKTLLKVAFSSRRKKLLTNLKVFGFSRSELEEIFKKRGLPLTVRAEELSPEIFLALAQDLSKAERAL